MNETPAARQARLILILLYLGYLLSFADRVIFSMTLKPIKAALGLSDTQLGLLSGVAFAASYALFAPLGGLLIDRHSRKRIMASAIAFWSMATFATALASTFLTMGLARAAVGIGESLLHPLSVSLLSDVVPPKRRPRAFAVYLSSGAAGSLVALVMGALLMHRLQSNTAWELPGIGAFAPWQGLFFAAALPGFLLAIAVLLSLREPERAAAASHGASASAGWSFLRRQPLICLALFGGISFLQMSAYTLSTWVILFFERVHHWPATKAALWLGSTSGLAALFGCLVAGRLIMWLRSKGRADAPLRIALFGGLMFVSFSIAGLISPWPLLAIGMLLLGAVWAYVPSIAGFVSLAETLPPAAKARLTGLHTLCNGVIANSLGPFLVGFFGDRLFPGEAGIRYALIATLAIACTVGTALLSVGLTPYRKYYIARTRDTGIRQNGGAIISKPLSDRCCMMRD